MTEVGDRVAAPPTRTDEESVSSRAADGGREEGRTTQADEPWNKNKMEESGGKSSGKPLSKDKMEGGTSGCFGKISKQVKVGGQRCNKKPTRQSHVGEETLQEEQSEDAEWLSTLSHSQLDMLIGLKELAILCAKKVGHEEVAEKFDLRMLRAIGSTLMEYLKGRIQNASIFPDSSQRFELFSGSQFAAPKHEKDLCKMALAEVIKSSSHPARKRLFKGILH